jgi:hypothetical protein
MREPARCAAAFGNVVERGRKFVLETDVFYSREWRAYEVRRLARSRASPETGKRVTSCEIVAT